MASSILSSGVSNINTISNLALVSPQENRGYKAQLSPSTVGNNQREDTTPGYLFNFEAENAFTLESDITDHFTENNSPVQDHIALRPEIVSVQGFIGEVTDLLLPGTVNGFGVQFIQSKLTLLGAYVPGVTEAALVAINNALLAYNAFTSAQQTIQSWTAEGTTKQARFFNQFYQDWLNRTLFTIQTPWTIMNDMAIMSLRAIQDADTRVITNFEIQFKKMRFVNTQTVSQLNDKVQQGRNAAQSATSQNNGTSVLQESPVSFTESFGRLTGNA